MADIDETISLFEHIRNRLPTGYGLGDDENIENDGVYNHKTFQQSLREDHEGDVGIFENNISEINILSGFLGYQGNIQVAVVTKNGDIDGAMKYLKEALELRKQAKNLAKAEKRLEKSELDYYMLEQIIKGTNKEIVIKLANGTTLTVKEEKEGTGYVSFNEKYSQAHK